MAVQKIRLNGIAYFDVLLKGTPFQNLYFLKIRKLI